MVRTRLTVLLLIAMVFVGCTQSRHFAVGLRLEKMGRYGEALAAYQAAAQQTPADKTGDLSKIHFRMGECMVRLNRMPEAFNTFVKAIDEDPKNVGARLRVGEFMLSAGAAERAGEQAQTAMLLSPRSGEAMALWGATLEALGQKDRAKQAYREAISMEPERTSVAIALADLYNHDNQTKEAREVLEKTATANPKSAAPRLAMARLHEQEGEISAAERSYRGAVQAEDTPETNLRLAQFLQRTARIAESEQVLRRVDAQRPTDPTALADFELNAGRPTSALSSYEAALGRRTGDDKAHASALLQERARLATRIVEADVEMASKQGGASAIQRAREHLVRYRGDLDEATASILEAEIALAENNLPLAAQRAAAAVTLAPHSAAALYTQGVVRLRCSDPGEARAQWLAALETDNHFAPARLALADQALEHGDLSGAEDYVLAVVRDEPGNMRALTLFARILAAQKRYASAAVIAQRAQALDSSSAVPHLLMGEIAMDSQRTGEALIQFEQAVLLDPRSKEAVEGLTRVYRTGKVTRPMLAKMEQVAAAPPASSTLMEIAGRLYAEHGWYEDAERSLTAALRLDPQRTTAAAALAEAFAKTGNLGAAADSAERAGGNAAALLAGLRAQEGNDVKGAIRNYERAVRGGEKSGVAANNLAWLYAQQGTNLDRALELAQTAQSLSPHNPAVLDTVGVVHLRLHEYSEAIKALESAKQLAVKISAGTELAASIRQHLTEAYLRAGNTVAADAAAKD